MRYSSTCSTVMVRQFQINKPVMKRHYDITLDGQQANEFYVVIREQTHTTPDLIFHAGPDREAPAVALSHILAFSQSFKLGFGDAADQDSVDWEDLTRANVRGSEHHWSMPTLAWKSTKKPRCFGSGDRQRFIWKRTRHVGVNDVRPATLSHLNWKLVREDDDEILAVFTSDWTLGKAGVLQINVDYGSDFDLRVLATCVSMYERARRG